MIDFSFDDKADSAVAVAQKQAAKMVTAITAETEANIRQLITDAIRSGRSPYEAAAEIRDLIGLTAAQGQAATKYKQQLIDSGLSAAKADEKAGEYADELLDSRAENIARTEIMDALNGGQDEAWQQAQKEGLLPTDAMKEWITTEEETCDECLAYDGKQVPISDEFAEGDPPLHPNCRCTIGIAAGTEAQTPEPEAPPPPPPPVLVEEPKFISVRDVPPSYVPKLDAITEVVTRMGFPAEDLEIFDYVSRFNVGRDEFVEAGHYNPGTNRVTLTANSVKTMTTPQLRGLVAHEVTHDQWEQIYSVGKRAAEPDAPNTIFAARLNRTPEQIDDAKAFYHEVQENINELAATDGVTEYSLAYWKEFERLSNLDDISEYKLDRAFETAVNETLAEIAKLKEVFEHAPSGPSATWKKIRSMLIKQYEDLP